MLYSTVRSTVLSAVREEGGATEVDAVVRMINWNVRKDIVEAVVIVAVSSSRWGSPSQ